MSMSGKMSVGMRAIVSTPKSTMRSAITTNVYGRRRAMRTSHMDRQRKVSRGIELGKRALARDCASFRQLGGLGGGEKADRRPPVSDEPSGQDRAARRAKR